MEIVINKTRKIKEIIGTVLAEKGFKYIRCERRLIWTFGRKVEEVEQEVYIQQHDYLEDDYKLMFWSSADGNGMEKIGGICCVAVFLCYGIYRMESDSRKRNIIERFLDLKFTKKLVILLDLLFWYICILPVIHVIADCVDGAVNGAVPWMSSFGNDAVEKIYGMDAVKDILSFYFGFLLAGVVMWIFWLIFTIGFTSYAMACTHYRKPQLYTDEGGFLHMVGEEDEQS